MASAWVYQSFTLVMFAASALCGIHAWGNRERFALYCSTVLYGLALEKLVIIQYNAYTYPAERTLDLFGIPLAIGFGWSAVVYAGYVTARRFDLADRYVPVFVGLYVLHVDLAMDAVAIRIPFWTWKVTEGSALETAIWFGVPIDNFTGWYLVGVSITAAFLLLRRRTENPALLGGGSFLLGLALLLPTLTLWHALDQEIVARKIALFSAIVVGSLLYLRRAQFSPRPVSHLVTAAVFLFHVYFGVLIVVFGIYSVSPVIPLASLAMAGIGVAVHAWPAVRRSRGESPATPTDPETAGHGDGGD